MTDSDAWAIRPEPHSTTETWKTRCDCCPALSCIRQPKRTQPFRYWCEDLRAQVNPRTITKSECPRGREAARGRKGKR